MHPVSRRTFFENCSLIAVGGMLSAHEAFASKLFAGSAPEPHIAFPSAPRDRISVASYPFRAYIESPANRDRDSKVLGITLLDFPSHVVAKFNVRNIEPHFRHFASLEPGYLDSFRKAMSSANVHAVNIAVGAERSIYDSDASAREAAIVFAKKWVEVAVQIGSPGIRTHIVAAKNSPPNVEHAAESLRRVVEYGAEKNIVITLENDDLVSEGAFFLVKIIEAVSNPYLRALPDFANSMLTGNADFNYRALQSMFEHAYNICHVKDGENDDNGKVFSVDLKNPSTFLRPATIADTSQWNTTRRASPTGRRPG